MPTLNELKHILTEATDYDDEMVVVTGYGKIKYNQVAKLAVEQLESATQFAKQRKWDQAAKQIEMYDLFAKAAAKAEAYFQSPQYKRQQSRK